VSPDLGKYLIAGFVILFTAIAGMSSVAYMDVAIGILATVSLLLALPFLLHRAGGWHGVQGALPPTHFQVLGDLSLMQGFELFLPTMLLMLGNQSMYQKFFSARSERDARQAVTGWVVGTVILETVIVAIAVVASSVFTSGEVHRNPREIIAYTALHGLPGWLGPLMMGAVFAKIISTANNYLFSPATNLVNDVFIRYLAPRAPDRATLAVSRCMVVLLGLWALYQAMHTQSVLQKTLYAYTIYSAALTPVILAAFYSRRANAAGAISAIAIGTLTTVCWDTAFVRHHLPAVLAERDAIFPALAAALFCLVVVSALTPPPAPRRIAPFFPDPEAEEEPGEPVEGMP
jgi:SSS family solute:Na+ symporter/sodium/proline symporter